MKTKKIANENAWDISDHQEKETLIGWWVRSQTAESSLLFRKRQKKKKSGYKEGEKKEHKINVCTNKDLYT